jgi:hypothetical protein
VIRAGRSAAGEPGVLVTGEDLAAVAVVMRLALREGWLNGEAAATARRFGKITDDASRTVVPATEPQRADRVVAAATVTLADYAEREGISTRAARKRCARGSVRGARKVGPNWIIEEPLP